MDYRLEDMICDVRIQPFVEVFMKICLPMKKLLYSGSTNFTRLSIVLRLMNLKAMNVWTNKGFTKLLQLLNEMLSKSNTFPD